MNTNYVLIDYENVQCDLPKVMAGNALHIKIFLGKHQNRLPLSLVNKLQILGSQVEYVQLQRVGKNALDFHIAYFLGRQVLEAPQAYFWIISKDRGYDPLIEYANIQGYHVKRVQQFSHVMKEACASNFPASNQIDRTRFDRYLSFLVDKDSSRRPKKESALRNSIMSFFKYEIQNHELEEVVAELINRFVITISDGRVRYQDLEQSQSG